MAGTVVSANLRAKQWDERFFLEYMRNTPFVRYMGTSQNAVIQVNERLNARKGDTIYCPLVAQPRGPHNDGSTALVNNEVQQFNDAWGSVVAPVRNAIVVNNMEEQASPIDIRNAARQGLRDMSVDYLKNHIIEALDDRTGSTNVATGTGGMTEDQWTAANADRTVFGQTPGDASAFQAQLDGIGSNNFDAETINTAKLVAETSGTAVTATNDRDAPNRIRPIKVAEDEEWFVLFVDAAAYKDIQGDTVIQGANREAWQRYGGMARTGGDGGNPIFRGGDIIYNGVIIRKVVDMDGLPVLSGTGNANIARGFLCGAQAVSCAWAQRTKTTIRKEDDYGYQNGVGFEEIRAVSKIHWERAGGATALRQWGMVSIFTGRV